METSVLEADRVGQYWETDEHIIYFGIFLGFVGDNKNLNVKNVIHPTLSLVYVGWKQTTASESSSIPQLHTPAEMPCMYYGISVCVSPVNSNTVHSAIRVHNMVKVSSFVCEHRYGQSRYINSIMTSSSVSCWSFSLKHCRMESNGTWDRISALYSV